MKYLSDIEANQLEMFLKARLKGNPREALLFLLALKTGARASEILALRKVDLMVFQKSVQISGLKGGNTREIPLPSWLFTALARYALTIEGDVIFTIGYERMVQLWYMWRTSRVNLHVLRHTFAVQLYKKTRDIRLVQQALGHKSITSTEVYQKYVYTQQELRKALCG